MSETLAQTTARITQFIQENAPTVDLSPGSIFNELILSLEAQIQNNVYNDLATLSASQSVATALASLEDTYNPIMDSIASNYGVVRNQGRFATGIISVQVSASTTITVPAGVVFLQPNLNFTYSTIASQTFTTGDGSLAASILNGVTTYYFNLNVQANTIGVAQTVADKTEFQLQNTSASFIPNFISATANGAFMQGQNQETDKQLIARFKAGQSVANFSTKDAINSVLAATYPSFQSVYLADHNDPINLRAANNPFNIKMPGYVDLYLRNSVAIPQVTFNLSGSYNGSTWTLAVPANMAPGFYRITSVVDPAYPNNPLPFSIVYGADYTAGDNSVQLTSEARYSVYQTATLTVNYVTTSTPVFTVTAAAPNLLQDVQNLLSDTNTRLPNADYLVKGVVPCEVSVYLSLTLSDSQPLNTVGLQSDIFNYINGLAVGQAIAVSKIINICHNYNVQQVNLPVIVKGTIKAPYNQSTDPITDYDILLSGTDTLAIPNLPQYGVTPNNTAFFVSYFGSSSSPNINITTQ